MKNSVSPRSIIFKRNAIQRAHNKAGNGQRRRNQELYFLKNETSQNISLKYDRYGNFLKEERVPKERNSINYPIATNGEKFNEFRRSEKNDFISTRRKSGLRLKRRRPRFTSFFTNRYGERTSGRGVLKYSGSKKRPSGPDNYSFSKRDSYLEPTEYRETYYDNDRYDGRDRDEYIHQNNIASEYNDYMNRGQYERNFHERGSYNPNLNKYGTREDERDLNKDLSFRHQGYQTSGNVEGFGIRGGSHQEQDWRDEDEYRRGHAHRKSGYGKYGSR